jgi:hypothetical protein
MKKMATRAIKAVGGTVENELDVIATLHTAMASAFAEIEAATKDKTNPHFKSKYADLGSVIDAIKPALIRYGLFFAQRSHPAESGVSVETILYHKNGEELSLGTLFVPANKQDAQGFGSALTYARRYGLMTAFGVPAEDDDGNAASRNFQPASQIEPKLPEDAGRGEGEMSSSALRASLRLLVHHINGCGSVADLEDVLDTEDAKEVIDNCQRRFPAWWETGESMPAEFVPLKKLIEQTREGLKKLESENV